MNPVCPSFENCPCDRCENDAIGKFWFFNEFEYGVKVLVDFCETCAEMYKDSIVNDEEPLDEIPSPIDFFSETNQMNSFEDVIGKKTQSLSWAAFVSKWNKAQPFHDDIYAIPKKGGDTYSDVKELYDLQRAIPAQPKVEPPISNQEKMKQKLLELKAKKSALAPTPAPVKKDTEYDLRSNVEFQQAAMAEYFRLYNNLSKKEKKLQYDMLHSRFEKAAIQFDTAKKIYEDNYDPKGIAKISKPTWRDELKPEPKKKEPSIDVYRFESDIITENGKHDTYNEDVKKLKESYPLKKVEAYLAAVKEALLDSDITILNQEQVAKDYKKKSPEGYKNLVAAKKELDKVRLALTGRIKK